MTKPKAVIPIYISKRDATLLLGCSMPTLDSLIKTGALPAYRFGPRSVRLKVTDVEALLEPVVPSAKAVGQ